MNYEILGKYITNNISLVNSFRPHLENLFNLLIRGKVIV